MTLQRELAQEAHEILDAAATTGGIGQGTHVLVMTQIHGVHKKARIAGLVAGTSQDRVFNPEWGADFDRRKKKTSTLEVLTHLGGPELAEKFSRFKGASRRERREKKLAENEL